MVNSGKTVAAIGNFDGVHLGHLHLLEQTKALCDELDARLGVALFDPHPQRFFQPDGPPFMLTAQHQRDGLLRAAGVEEIYSLPFDKDFASLSPEDFVKSILVDRLALSGVVTGVDFRFGRARAGDVALLRQLGERFGLEVRTGKLLGRQDTDKVGSSGVRAALRAGNMRAAAEQLGRDWSVYGIVEEGQKLGRTIGFATANMVLGSVIEPRRGVYATRTIVDGKIFNSVSNFGRRPTVGADAPLLETHIFDFEGDLYGRPIEVEFVDFLRDEKKFDGLDPLKAQIAQDCTQALEIFKSGAGQKAGKLAQ